MGDRIHTLSKSDFKAARTCATKLYYRELGYPDTKQDDEYLAMLAEGGYMVEKIAKLGYPDGIDLEYGPDVEKAARETREHLQRERVTLFEATLLAGRMQARVDILDKHGDELRLIEVKAKSFDTTDVPKGAEHTAFLTKKGTVRADWREYLEDVTYQVLVLREMMPGRTVRPFMAFVDKAASTSIDRLPGWFTIHRRERADGSSTIHHVEFTGDADRLRTERLLVVIDVSAVVDLLIDEVRTAAAEFVATLDGAGSPRKVAPLLRVACKDCEYRVGDDEKRSGFRECWGRLALPKPHLFDLYKVGTLQKDGAPLADILINQGRTSLLDVDPEDCTKKDGTVGPDDARRRRQLLQVKQGKAWCAPELAGQLRAARYPLHFIDFETTRLAIPYHAGMRPYGLVAFQWSCHTLDTPGAELRHNEWLADATDWPNHDFASTLRAQIGNEGTVLSWATHEASTLRQVADDLPSFMGGDRALENWIAELTHKEHGRILDLNKVARDHYLHPEMGGRTSIKVVLNVLWQRDAELRAEFERRTGLTADPEGGPYASLPAIEINGTEREVAEGTAAMRAYEAMSFGVERDDPVLKAKWRSLLLQYCKLDTLAMVLIWNHWSRQMGTTH